MIGLKNIPMKYSKNSKLFTEKIKNQIWQNPSLIVALMRRQCKQDTIQFLGRDVVRGITNGVEMRVWGTNPFCCLAAI